MPVHTRTWNVFRHGCGWAGLLSSAIQNRPLLTVSDRERKTIRKSPPWHTHAHTSDTSLWWKMTQLTHKLCEISFCVLLFLVLFLVFFVRSTKFAHIYATLLRYVCTLHHPSTLHPSFLSSFHFLFILVCLLVALRHFCLRYCLRPILFFCQRFLNPVISPPFPPQPHTALAVLASETKGKMKAFVLQWLCIWCQSGSLFMMVQTVIRVYPYKELLPLMGLVWIYNWQTHTFSVVGGG